MDHDAAHKYIYSLPEVAADLLRIVAQDWVGELDLFTMEDRSSEYLDAAHRKRLGDMVFSVRLCRRRPSGGVRPYVLVLVEFQSEVDGRMAKRMRETAGVSSSGSRRDLDIEGAAGGGLAIEEPGVGDGAAAGGGNAAGVAAMLAGGGGPFPWTGEQAVPAGAAFLGAGAVGAQDRRWFGLPGL